VKKLSGITRTSKKIRNCSLKFEKTWNENFLEFPEHFKKVKFFLEFPEHRKN